MTIYKLSSRLFLFGFMFSFVSPDLLAQDMMVFQSNMRSKGTSQFYEEEFQRIGNYKVKGNSYLLKGTNVSDLFTTLGYGVNMPLVYDAYTQNVSVMQENKKDIVTLSFEELDSFMVKIDHDKRFTQPAVFINATKIEPGKKIYLQRLTNGPKYSLYKSYKADMRPAALDLAQTNVMEFEIVSEYFYLPAGAHQFVKIKSNWSSLKKQFAAETAALQVLNTLTKENIDDTLSFFFDILNSKQ